MNWVDYLILAIIAVSALISLVRGFVREVVSIVVWACAFWLSILFAQPFAGFLVRYIDSPTARIVSAFVLLFVGVLLIGMVVQWLAGLLVDKTGLSGTDRVLGMVFGAARGLVIVCALILLAGLTRVPEETFWRQSALIRPLQPLVCKFGVGEWMDGFVVYTPVAQGMPVATGRPVQGYWSEFCGGTVTKRTEARIDGGSEG